MHVDKMKKLYNIAIAIMGLCALAYLVLYVLHWVFMNGVVPWL